jgi:hypothetical protein
MIKRGSEKCHGIVLGECDGCASLCPAILVLHVFAASAAYVHFRGRERLRIGRQAVNRSTWCAPYNVLMYLFSPVPNKPVLSSDDFPGLKVLRDNWQTIRDEAVKPFDEGHIRAAAKNNDWGFYSFFRSGWKRFYLKWCEDFCPRRRRCVRRRWRCSIPSRTFTGRRLRCCRRVPSWRASRPLRRIVALPSGPRRTKLRKLRHLCRRHKMRAARRR